MVVDRKDFFKNEEERGYHFISFLSTITANIIFKSFSFYIVIPAKILTNEKYNMVRAMQSKYTSETEKIIACCIVEETSVSVTILVDI